MERQLDVTLPDGREVRTRYGLDPTRPDEPWWVQIADDRGRMGRRQRFRSMYRYNLRISDLGAAVRLTPEPPLPPGQWSYRRTVEPPQGVGPGGRRAEPPPLPPPVPVSGRAPSSPPPIPRPDAVPETETWSRGPGNRSAIVPPPPAPEFDPPPGGGPTGGAPRTAGTERLARLARLSSFLRLVAPAARAISTIGGAADAGWEIGQGVAIAARGVELGEQHQAELAELDEALAADDSARRGVAGSAPGTSAPQPTGLAEQIGAALAAARASLDPAGWDARALGSAATAVELVGRVVWARIGPSAGDAFLTLATRPLSGYGIPASTLAEIAAGAGSALRRRGQTMWDIAPDFIGRLTPFGFVEWLHEMRLLRVGAR
ncbi:hypothetical protein [Microbacterium sp. BK668]|uniref:hypothetical protein n=1 Tax=Microbacterium sp. BK668 TaxID=2512118 RepID=UPI00106057FE|nr:hypothetical protein [Microbacterium sp. BK668]